MLNSIKIDLYIGKYILLCKLKMMDKLVELLNTINSDELDIIIKNFNNIEKANINANISNQIIEIQKVASYFKKTEFNFLINNTPGVKESLKLYCIEDWQDSHKINKIKILILLESLDKFMFSDLVADKSKKTYASGHIVKTDSLVLEKIFSQEYQLYSKQFYTKLDVLILQIVNTHNIEYKVVKESTELMDNLIQSEISCRNKYETNNLAEYKTKINDILETRNKENDLYSLFYSKLYQKMLSHPANSPLKYAIENEWKNIKENYRWLAEIITYINNSTKDSKEYLMNLGINFSPNIKDIIGQLIIKYGLNMKNLKDITDFMHDIAETFRHTTYIKWHFRELRYINIFEQYQNNSINQNINMLANKLFENITNIELKNELIDLMFKHYNTILHMFS